MGYNSDESANMAEVPEEYVFDNPGEAVSKAQEMGLDGAADEIIHTHGEGEDTTFMPAATHDDLMGMLREEGELAPSAEFSEGDLVRWSTSASPGTGRVAEVASEPGESVSAEGADVTREATEDEAAYKLDDYVGPEAGYDEGVVVKSASEILGAWDDAPEAAEMAAAGDTPATDDADSPDSGRAEAGGERTGTKATDYNAHMSDTEEELRARLSSKDDRIAELQNEVEQLEDEREDVARAYAEALAAGVRRPPRTKREKRSVRATSSASTAASSGRSTAATRRRTSSASSAMAAALTPATTTPPARRCRSTSTAAPSSRTSRPVSRPATNSARARPTANSAPGRPASTPSPTRAAWPA